MYSEKKRLRLLLLVLPVALLVGACTRLSDIFPDDNTITSFIFTAADNPGLSVNVQAVIADTTISAELPAGSSVTNLVARITHTGYRILQGGQALTGNSSTNNYSAPVIFVVQAENGTLAFYTVTVTVAAIAPKAILTFGFSRTHNPAMPADYTGVISGTNITVTMSVDVDRSDLAAWFTTSGTGVTLGTQIQVSGVTRNNFLTNNILTVRAADNTTTNYLVTIIPHDFAGGAGTEIDPYLVSTDREMDRVRWYMGAHFRQIASFSLTNYANWVPIGVLGAPFFGSYDGDNHVIDGLTINRPTSNFQALFGIADGATLKDITLTNIAITGYNRTGGLAGRLTNNSQVSGCTVHGTIAGNGRVGGLAGDAYGGTVVRSSATVTMTGAGQLGGLLGAMDQGATAAFCHTSGSITATAFGEGGIAGQVHNNCVISNSYSHVNIHGRYNAGLVGSLDFGSVVTHCFSTGLITANNPPSDYPRGLICSKGATAVVTNSFWDTESSGRPDSMGGTGLTTAQMWQQASYANWDFTTVWRINEGSGYPTLR